VRRHWTCGQGRWTPLNTCLLRRSLELIPDCLYAALVLYHSCLSLAPFHTLGCVGCKYTHWLLDPFEQYAKFNPSLTVPSFMSFSSLSSGIRDGGRCEDPPAPSVSSLVQHWPLKRCQTCDVPPISIGRGTTFRSNISMFDYTILSLSNSHAEPKQRKDAIAHLAQPLECDMRNAALNWSESNGEATVSQFASQCYLNLRYETSSRNRPGSNAGAPV
jgi:hypothetical protein